MSCSPIVSERVVCAFSKQRCLPPRNGTPDTESVTFILLGGDQRRELLDVGRRLRRERSTCCQMLLIAQRTRVIGRKEAGRSEAVMHLFEVCGAGQYVVVRIKWVETEPIANAEFYPGARHDLHQPHCAARRRRSFIASTFHLHDSANPTCRNNKAIGRFRYELGKPIGGISTRQVLCGCPCREEERNRNRQPKGRYNGNDLHRSKRA